jgi:nucleoside-diphosphate-sugar epimerase
MLTKRVNLVAGALGVAGRAAIEELCKNKADTTIGLSRRQPDFDSPATFISVDLLDEKNSAQVLKSLDGITHVYYAAYAPGPSLSAEVEPNLNMLKNLITSIESTSSSLTHVCLVQGSKWYGNHLGPYKTPARESDPRHMPPNFYYDQQDWLAQQQKGKPWSWSSFRPHGLCGVSVGSAMNQLLALAVYATISKELQMPLKFPGKSGAFKSVYQFTDANLLARAMIWTTQNTQCQNQAFNLTNGDVDRWENIWPNLAHMFELQPGGVQTISLATFMSDKQGLWDQIVSKYGLKPYKLEQLVNWQFADWVYSSEFDQISSLELIRRTGWNETLRAEDMFRSQFEQLRAQRIIP